jgi:hypothetical protein
VSHVDTKVPDPHFSHILQLNHPDRIAERRRLIRVGQYPFSRAIDPSDAYPS